ncbi:MAG: potassium-transporting ATPase subunit KdpC [Acidaminococcaceae bacterium]
MVKSIINSFFMIIIMTLITGIAYPLATTGIAQIFFPAQANGSLISYNGTTVGSKFIGQNFSSDAYFHSRPSAAGNDGYDATASGGSNIGPTNKKLLETAKERIIKIKKENNLPPETSIPSDLVLASASGLDPHISPESAYLQVERVATARGLSVSKIESLVQKYTEHRQLGFLGEPRVNVLELNLALDSIK